MNLRVYSRIYFVIVIISLLLLALPFKHPGPFFVGFFRIPPPRALLEIVLGILCLMIIAFVTKFKINKATKNSFMAALVGIVLYFILRFIHIPGRILWFFLVLCLAIIVWSAIAVLVNKGKWAVLLMLYSDFAVY